MPHLRCYRPAGSPHLTARSRQSPSALGMPHLRCYRPAGSPHLTARSRQSVYQKRIAVSLLNKFKADCYFFFGHTSLVTADWYSPSGWYPLPSQPRGLPGSPIRPETVHGAYHRLQIPGQHWLRICPALSSHYCGHPFLPGMPS